MSVKSHAGVDGCPPFSDDELEFRRFHLDEYEVPEHHFARADAALDQRADEVHKLAFAAPAHGFDVSSYQPAGPDFAANGRRFAIFKATESLSYFDPHFAANRAKAHALGLPFIGMYHFARPGSSSGAAQARYLLGKVGARQPGEVLICDFETSPWSVPWIVEFLNTLHAAGWPTEFYSYLGMLSANPTDGIPQTNTGLWVAAYGCREPGNDRWAQKDLWQHTDGASSVCGNDGPWDCSVGDINALTARAGTSPSPTPSPTQEEPVGAFALPTLGPGEEYTFRPPPAEHSGGIPFGAVFVSFGADFGDAAIRADAPVPLRLAYWDNKANVGVVPFGGGSFDKSGKWVEDNKDVPPLYVPTNGDVIAVQWHANMSKGSLVHCGRLGRVTPLVEYQAG